MGKLAPCKRSKRRSNKQLRFSLSCLPQELITEIIADVSASSFTDFLSTTLVCKDFYKLSKQEEDYIYGQVSMETFPIVAWRNIGKHSQFFKQCYQNKNPEALYRQGVVHYFGGARLDCAVRCLEEAANLGHLGAYYAMGIILVLCGGESKQKGIALLGGMKKSNILRDKVKGYRKRLQNIIRMIWKNKLIMKERPSCCTMQHQKRNDWSMDDIEEDEIRCEGCASDIEIASICNIL